MGSTDYEFRTVWRVAGTPEEVAAVLGDATALPRWWPSVYLSVEPVAGGPEPGPGIPRPHASAHEGLAALYAPLDPHGYGARHGPRLRPHRGRRSERHRPLDLRAGRAGNGHHLRLARQRRQAPAAAAELAAEAGLRRQPPLGDGPRPGEPRPGTAPAPRGSGGTSGRTAAGAAAVPPPPPPTFAWLTRRAARTDKQYVAMAAPLPFLPPFICFAMSMARGLPRRRKGYGVEAVGQAPPGSAAPRCRADAGAVQARLSWPRAIRQRWWRRRPPQAPAASSAAAAEGLRGLAPVTASHTARRSSSSPRGITSP